MDPLTTITLNLKYLGAFGLSQVTRYESAKLNEHVKYRVEKWRIIYSIILIATIISIGPIQVSMSDNWPCLNLTQKVGYVYWATMNPFVSCLAISCAIWQRKKLLHILNEYSNIVERLEKLTEIGQLNTRKFLSLYGAAYIIILIVNYRDLQKIYILEYIGITYHFAISIYFGIFILALASILKDIRVGLSKTLQENSLQKLDNFFSSSPRHIEKIYEKRFSDKSEKQIRTYRIIYHDLYEVSVQFNELFSTMLFFLMGHLTLSLIHTFYNKVVFAQRVLANDEALDIMDLIEGSVWSLYGLTMMAWLINPCEQAESRTEDLKISINKYLVRCECKDTIKELTRFLNLVQQEKIKFSPHGMFPMASNILITIIGVGISYAVLLTQVPKIQ